MDISTLGRFHVAPGYDPSLPATWVWEDRSGDVNHKASPAITIKGGRADEVSEVEAGSCVLEVDNAGGHYCAGNPYSRWFGRLAIGCPARWGTISGAEAWTVNTATGWGTPDVGTSWTLDGGAGLYSSTGGLGTVSLASASSAVSAHLDGADARNGDATWAFVSGVVATGAPLIYNMQARFTSSSDHLMFSVELGLSGVVTAKIRRQFGGSLTDLVTVVAGFTYSAAQRLKARCQWDGQDLRLRVWVEASGEPTTWTATATDSQCTGSAVTLRAWRFAGNTNAGTVVFSFDDLEIEAVEVVGFLPELPIRWDPTATVSWVPLEIAGISRWLSQGTDEIQSPIYRQLSAQPVAAYWTFEDDAGTTSAASAVARGFPAAIVGGALGSTDCPPGAKSALTLTTGGTSKVGGPVGRWPLPQDGHASMCYARFPTLPASSAPVAAQKLMEIGARGTVVRWVVYGTSTGFYLEGYQADDTLLVNVGSFAYVIDPTKWFAIQLEASESGATVTWALIWHQVGSSTFFAGTNTYTGTADLLLYGTLYAPVDGTLVSHFWLGDDLLNFVDVTFELVSAAYPGETATARIARIFREKHIPALVEPGIGETLGPQALGQVLDVARTSEAADMGVLYETGAGYGYRPRVARYNRPVWMSMAIAPAGDIADDPQAASQDLRMRNWWKVTRDGGGSAVDYDPVHIARYGRRPDTVTVGIFADGRLLGHASWRVHLGTWDEMRWTQLIVDLTDRPSLLNLWRGRPYGPRITISGIPSQGPVSAPADLIVEGWTQEISSVSWRLILACSPAKPWDVGVYGTTQYGSATTTTSGTLPATGGSGVSLGLTIAAAKDVWSTTTFGYQMQLNGTGGETVTVTGMTAPSGTAPSISQTATVTRGANGVIVAHNAGEAVQIYPAPRWAL
jgi:hypothetical protein